MPEPTATAATSEPDAESVTTGVVVGVDLSPSCQGALTWASDTAAVYGLPLTILVARPDAEGDVEVQEYAEDLEGGIETAVAGVRDRHPDLVVHGIRYPTPPVQSLLAASEDAELLVVGARGWEGFTGLLVGSTALNVVPYAKCPVVVVHPTPAAPAAGEEVDDQPHAGRVVVGYDGSISSNAAAALAIRHAAAVGAGVTMIVVHIRRGSTTIAQIDPANAEPGSPEASFWAPIILISSKYPDVPITYWRAEGRPGAVLVEQSRGSLLLAVGSRGRGGFRGLVMGSVSQQLMAHAQCPVGVLHVAAAEAS